MLNKKNSDKTCNICLEQAYHPVKCPTCQRRFCTTCAYTWREIKNQCPLKCHKNGWKIKIQRKYINLLPPFELNLEHQIQQQENPQIIQIQRENRQEIDNNYNSDANSSFSDINESYRHTDVKAYEAYEGVIRIVKVKPNNFDKKTFMFKHYLESLNQSRALTIQQQPLDETHICQFDQEGVVNIIRINQNVFERKKIWQRRQESARRRVGNQRIQRAKTE